MRLGLETCLANPPEALRKGRFALLCNHSSVDRDLRSTADVLAKRFPGQLVALLTPQHGFWGEQQANMIESPHMDASPWGAPIYSLYSETRQPTAEMLDGCDCLVVDLQDVGCRVYTFIWTVAYCLEACAAADLPVIVLDRPNPLGGAVVEGPPLAPGFESFVGRAAIPMRHGLTIGEMARFLNDSISLGAELHVAPLEGWKPEKMFGDTGLTWIPPSPNLPTAQSALVYSGQVLLEGANLSEGRGTTTPFEVAGAPFVDPYALADDLDAAELPGVAFRPVRFVPVFDKWAGESCGGVAFHVTDATTFRAYRTTLQLLAAVRSRWPKEFRWTGPPYEYEEEKMPIDILSGNSDLRETFDAGRLSAADLDRLASVDLSSWTERTVKCRIYERLHYT